MKAEPKNIMAEELFAAYTNHPTHPVILVFRQTDKRGKRGYLIHRVQITQEALQKALDPNEIDNLPGVLEQSKNMVYSADVRRWVLAQGLPWNPPPRTKMKEHSGCFCVECLGEEEEKFYVKHKGQIGRAHV